MSVRVCVCVCTCEKKDRSLDRKRKILNILTVEEKARVGANKSQIYRNEKETESSQLEIVFFLKITRRKVQVFEIRGENQQQMEGKH